MLASLAETDSSYKKDSNCYMFTQSSLCNHDSIVSVGYIRKGGGKEAVEQCP